jgi:hypothetical protein
LLTAVRLAFTFLLTTSLLIQSIPAPPKDEECFEADRSLYSCPPPASATAQNDHVDINATKPGNPGAAGGGGQATNGNRQSDKPTGVLPWEENPNYLAGPGTLPDGTEYEGGPPPIIREPWEMISPTILDADAVVTVDDIASFRPTPGTLVMEPNGWTIAGLDTNFWVDVAVSTPNGELFGTPASVRFTPASYRFDYGDSAMFDRTSAGGSWETQHLAEFDATPTGHRYTAPGTYSVTASVEFTAEYRFDGDTWLPVLGTVRVPTNPLNVVVARATTVLVSNNCLVTPSGTGC